MNTLHTPNGSIVLFHGKEDSQASIKNTVDFLQMPKAASLFFYSSDGVYSSK